MERELQKQRLNIDDLTMLIRSNHIFSITEIDYAILEPNGELSIIKNSGKKAVIKEDLNIPTPTTNFIPNELIVDGIIIKNNLNEYNLNHNWLTEELNKQGIQKITDVLYAELQRDGKLYIQKKQQL